MTPAIGRSTQHNGSERPQRVAAAANSSEQSRADATIKRICVLGASLDVDNRGVLALAVSLAHLLARSCPGAELVFLYGSRTSAVKSLEWKDGKLDIAVRNCRLSPRSARAEHILVILATALLFRLGLRGPARRNPWLRALLDADLIGDIRGGDSFSDIYGLRRFVVGSLPLLSVILLGRRYTLFPQTYGPFRSPLARVLARLMLRRAHQILTRDRNCDEVVKAICGRAPCFCPDVAFTLEARPPANSDAIVGGHDSQRPLIGVNVSGLLYMGGYTRRNMFGLRDAYRDVIDQLLESLLTSTAARILFVPHVFGSESEEEATALLLNRLAQRFPGRLASVTGPLSERELKWVIGQTEFFVGSRMHACIGALSQGIPTVGLAYSAKFRGVFDSAGVGECVIDLRAVDGETAIATTLAAFERRAQIGAALAPTSTAIRQAVVRCFEEIGGSGSGQRDRVRKSRSPAHARAVSESRAH